MKEKAGVASLRESTANLNAELLKTRDALRAAETEHAEQQALLRELEKPRPGQDKNLRNAQLPLQTVKSFSSIMSVIARLANLRQTDLELVSKYTQKTDQRSSARRTRTHSTNPLSNG